MSRSSGKEPGVPAAQRIIRDGAVHPHGGHVEFGPGEVEQSLGRRFEEQVRKHGDRLAIKVHGEDGSPQGRQWTYGELNRAANRLAHTILVRGGEQTPVALLANEAAPTVAAMLGALKAGRIFVTLDPDYPVERLRYMLRDSGAELVLTLAGERGPGAADRTTLAAQLGVDRRRLIDMAEAMASGSGASDENPDVEVPPDALAYIIYTSGSTGKPKGIAFDHRSVLAGIRNYTNAFHISAADRLTLLHSISFSSAMVDIFCALLNGASLYPWNVKVEGLGGLERWLAEEEVTICDWVPTPFRYFVDALSGETRFPHLRLLVLASEAVTRREVDLYRAHFAPSCVLVNRLGATETYNYRLYFMDHETPLEGNLVPAGYPVPDKDVLLLDEDGQAAGPGEPGEIVVRSRYLARGYWRQPELTAAAFRPEPSGGEERLYWTGDLGLIHEDGLLEYLGRKDFQVKIRGFRIEMAEIERALREIETVEDAVVMAEPTEAGEPAAEEPASAQPAMASAPGEKRLVGYIVPADGDTPSTKDLRQMLARTLPDYMIPSAFLALDEIPLTPSGKVDRKALAAAAARRQAVTGSSAGRNGDPGAGGQRGAPVEPRDEMERRMVRAWQRVLGRQEIGVTDNFFDLGGHSMSAVRLLVEIERQFGQKLAPPTFYQYPTVEELTQVLRRKAGRPEQGGARRREWSPLVAVQRPATYGPTATTKPPFFCLPGNLGNVFTDLGDLARFLGPDQPFYGFQDGPQNPARIPNLASLYVREMQREQPHGPYFLGGVCLGAVVAYEMGQQLLKQGEEVALLAMIEPARPWRPSPAAYLSFLHYLYDHFLRRFAYARKGRPPQGLAEQSAFLSMKLKVVRNVWALRQYTPQPYAGPIRAFLSEGSLSIPDNRQLDWQHLARGGWSLDAIPGDHGSITGDNRIIIEPAHMRVLAQKLRTYIDQANNFERREETHGFDQTQRIASPGAAASG
jgi:amino acid adenylation domain-containing protein